MSYLFAIDSLVLGFWSPGPGEMMLLAIVALLLYGGNLPEVARSWGKTLAEFRRSISGIQSEINDVIYSDPDQLEYHGDDLYDSQGYDGMVAEVDDDNEEEEFDGEKTVGNSSKDTVIIEDGDSQDKPVD